MKKIILIRHAKSSWKHNLIDHERPLSKRGNNDAQIVSKKLKEDDYLNVDLVLSSDSVRTKNTSAIFIENLKINNDIIRYTYDLYDFSGQKLIEVVKSCKDNVNELMLFGHNYAITEFANTYGHLYIDNVPTCGVVIIEFDIENWKDLKKGKTFKTLFPRVLKS